MKMLPASEPADEDAAAPEPADEDVLPAPEPADEDAGAPEPADEDVERQSLQMKMLAAPEPAGLDIWLF